MYRLQVRCPGKYAFDVVEALSDVMDTEMALPTIDMSGTSERPTDIAVKAKSLGLVDVLHRWLVQAPADAYVEVLAGSEAISLRERDLAAAKTAIERASAGA
mgnify:CR=1 FL=1